MHLIISSANWRPFCLGGDESMVFYQSDTDITWTNVDLFITHRGQNKLVAILQTRYEICGTMIRISQKIIHDGQINKIAALRAISIFKFLICNFLTKFNHRPSSPLQIRGQEIVITVSVHHRAQHWTKSEMCFYGFLWVSMSPYDYLDQIMRADKS